MQEVVIYLILAFLFIICIINFILSLVFYGPKGNTGEQGPTGEIGKLKITDNLQNFSIVKLNLNNQDEITISQKNGFLYVVDSQINNLESLTFNLDETPFLKNNILIFNIFSGIAGKTIIFISDKITNLKTGENLNIKIVGNFYYYFYFYSIEENKVLVNYNII